MKLSLVLLVAFLAIAAHQVRSKRLPKPRPHPKGQPLPKDPEVPEDDNESLKDFDKRNNVIDERTPEQKAQAEKNLKRVEDKVNKNNQAFRKGTSTHTEQVYSNADEDPKQIEQEHEGYNPEADQVIPAGQSRSTGFIPDGRDYNTPEEQAVLDEAYAKMAEDRGSTYPNGGYNGLKVPYGEERVNYGGLYTPAKNQKACGSCAAFATTGLIESALLRQTYRQPAWKGRDLYSHHQEYTEYIRNKRRNPNFPTVKGFNLDLSEQHLIDCAFGQYGANGCHGAGAATYPFWVAYYGGTAFGQQLLHEGQYPYMDRFPYKNCNKAREITPWSSGFRVSKAYIDREPSNDQIKKAVYNKGAVWAGMDARPLGNYWGGVMEQCGDGGSGNHAVLIVGWGREPSRYGVDRDYWLVKNSWGDSWGENGLFKISMHSRRRDGKRQCLLGYPIVWVDIARSDRRLIEYPPKVKKTYTPPTNLRCDITKHTYRRLGTGTFKNLKFRGYDDHCIELHDIKSNVYCENNICEPLQPGPSNVCNYMFGRVDCPNRG